MRKARDGFKMKGMNERTVKPLICFVESNKHFIAHGRGNE